MTDYEHAVPSPLGEIEIQTQLELEKYVEAVASRREQIARYRAQCAALVAEVEAELAAIEAHQGASVREYARSQLRGSKKSVKTMHGTIQFRTTAPAVQVADAKAVVPWLLAELGEQDATALYSVDARAFASRFKPVESEGEDVVNDDQHILDTETGVTYNLADLTGLAIKPRSEAMSVVVAKAAADG